MVILGIDNLIKEGVNKMYDFPNKSILDVAIENGDMAMVKEIVERAPELLIDKMVKKIPADQAVTQAILQIALQSTDKKNSKILSNNFIIMLN